MHLLFPNRPFFLQAGCQSSNGSGHQLILINKELGCLMQVDSTSYPDTLSQALLSTTAGPREGCVCEPVRGQTAKQAGLFRLPVPLRGVDTAHP